MSNSNEAIAAAMECYTLVANRVNANEPTYVVEFESIIRKHCAAKDAEIEQLSDALVSARRQLGKDELPFVCDSIAKIQQERDELKKQLAMALDAADKGDEEDMSAAPLTDKFAFGFAKPNVGDGVEICHHSNAEWRIFCGCIEQERDQLKARVESLQSIIDSASNIGYGKAVTQEIERLQASRDTRLQELERKAKALDWLEYYYNNPANFTLEFCNRFFTEKDKNGLLSAIESAMAKQK